MSQTALIFAPQRSYTAPQHVQKLSDDRWRASLQIDEIKTALRYGLMRVRSRAQRIALRQKLEQRLRDKLRQMRLLDTILDQLDPVFG